MYIMEGGQEFAVTALGLEFFSDIEHKKITHTLGESVNGNKIKKIQST